MNLKNQKIIETEMFILKIKAMFLIILLIENFVLIHGIISLKERHNISTGVLLNIYSIFIILKMKRNYSEWFQEV